MKNTRIIQAYDTVSPTDAQKQNMRSALEGKLRDAEKPRDFSLDFTIPETPKPAENTRKPNYQSVKSAKPRRSLFPILAAVLAVAVAGGLFLGVMNGKLENSPSYAPPTTAQTVPVPEETQAGALPEGYQEIVDTYGKAVEEGWDATKCMELGICYMVKDIDRLDVLGYALCDLDEDGSEELIITDGELIYDLYTLNSRGETLELAQSIERDRFYLSKANIIAEVASSGASSSAYHFAKLNETQLKLVDAVIYSAGYDPENPWFRGESQVPITEEEANAILDTYPHLYIPHTTLSGQPQKQSEDTGLPAAYQEIVDTYVTAVEEGWNPAQCSEANISILSAEVTSPDDVGYTLVDVDEDGSQELLMTDGDLIYDMFSLSPEGEAILWVTSMDRIQYRLCLDNLISCVGSSSAARSYYTYYRFSNNTLDKIIEVTYDGERDRENPWFLGDQMQPLTSLEANKIVSEDHPYRYLPYTTLSGTPPMPEEVPDAQTLEGYAQALSPLMGGDIRTMFQLFCFYDYDRDGELELLLGNGQSIYQILEETRPGVIGIAPFYVSQSGAVYLCENDIMEYIGYNQGYAHFTYMERGSGEKVAYVFTDDENWYTQNDLGETITISEAAANTVRGSYRRLSLPWKKMDQFPAPIPDGDGVTLSPLFVNIFLPFAGEGKTITEEELKHELANLGMGLETGEGTYYVEDIGRAGAYLSTPMGDISSMTYTISGDFGRFVRATMEEDGIHYYLGAYLHEYPAESVEALQQLIQADNDTISLWRTAESYAMEYFEALAQQEREAMSKEQGREIYPVDYSYNIQAITGLNIWKEQFAKNGSVEIDIAAYVDSPDSFTWLTMKCEQVDGAWQVTDAWLQK